MLYIYYEWERQSLLFSFLALHGVTQIVVIVKGVSPIPYHSTRSYSKKNHNVLYLKRSTKHIAILLLSTSLYQECKQVTNQFLMSMNSSHKHCIFFQIPERMNMSENASLQCWPESTPLQTTKLAVLSTIFFLTLVFNVLILVAILSLKQKVNSFL